MTSILKVNQIQNTAGAAPTATDLGLNVTGSVVQVVVGTISSSTTTTSSSLVDTGLTASITPTSSSNKILVLATITGAGVANGSGVRMKLFRGSTDLGFISSTGTYSGSANAVHLEHGWSVSVLDTPSTTSSTTYKVQHSIATNGTVYISGGNSISSITLMEIAQ